MAKAPDVEQFARDNSEIVQIIGVGTQDDFALAQDFVDRTGLNSVDLLWDPTRVSWNTVGVRTNSAMQLYSHDLSQKSSIVFWSDDTKQLVLEAAPQEPFAPPGAGSASS